MDPLPVVRAEIENDPAGLGYAGKTAAEKVALLNAATRQASRPVRLHLAEMMPLVAQASLAAVFNHPAFTAFRVDVEAQDLTAVGAWLQAFAAVGAISADELTALMTYVGRTEQAAVSRAAELGLGEVGLVNAAGVGDTDETGYERG